MTIICEHCGQENHEYDSTCIKCDRLIIREPDSLLDDDLEPISDEIEEQIRSKLASQIKIIREIGRGGMALVYQAHDPSLQRKLAVKCMPLMLNRDQTVIQRFKREAQVMANMNHPHIVQVYSVGEVDGIHFFTMSWLSGGDLSARLRTKPSLEESIRIIREAASALDYAHAKGLVHRDIKPGNIMFDEHGATKILDFGIAKILDRTQLTMTRSFMGTPYYMSPEQARGHQVDGRSDLYSLGVVFYQLVTGMLPFESDDPMAIIYKHVEEKPKPPNKRNSDLPPAVSKIIMKLIEKSPDKRYQSGAELVEALNGVMAPVARLTLSQPMRRNQGGKVVKAPKAGGAPRLNLDRPTQLGIAGVAMLLLGLTLPLFSRKEVPIERPDQAPSAPVFARVADNPNSLTISRDDPGVQLVLFCPENPNFTAEAEAARAAERRDQAQANRPAPRPTPPKPDPKIVAERARVARVKDLIQAQEWAEVPGGEFRMGNRRRKETRPVRTIQISAFTLAKTEVTQELFEAVLGYNPSCHKDPAAPVENVSFVDVEAFINKLNDDTDSSWRLPTEAEWEYAARTNMGRRENLDAQAWYNNPNGHPKPVAQKAAGILGLFDMQGNVAEWCADWYATYPAGPAADPPGPTEGSHRIIRGGAYPSSANEAKVFYRAGLEPEKRSCFTGFRLVKGN